MLARRCGAVFVGVSCAVLSLPAVGHAASGHQVRLGAPAAHGQVAHSAGGDPLADPAANVDPSNAFLNACYAMGTSKPANDTCDAAAVHDFNAVRSSEGLGPMRLPGDFAVLAVPVQLLVISNIERVDRGLVPVAGLSSALNAYAQQGADADADPPFPDPFRGTAGSANWAGAGDSALLDDFFWMYDDGLGSGNLDCTQSDQSGCWGHRHDILYAFGTPLLMGAAVTYNTGDGTSMAEEFIGGDTTDRPDVPPTWATITKVPTSVSLSASARKVKRHHKVTLTGKVVGLDPQAGSAGQHVVLQRRRPHSDWTALGSKRTDSSGVVRFHLRPTRSAKYRLAAPSGSQGTLTSRVLRIAVHRHAH
jgi:hypothetical protein